MWSCVGGKGGCRINAMYVKLNLCFMNNSKIGFAKKCDLDVEVTVDLIKEREKYDTIIIFSGDGDLMCAVRYLKDYYKKQCCVFGARDHIGREIFDAKAGGYVKEVLYVEDFEYRLSSTRFKWS